MIMRSVSKSKITWLVSVLVKLTLLVWILIDPRVAFDGRWD